MIIADKIARDEEALCDALADLILSPEFAQQLDAVHSNRRYNLPLRSPEVVYTSDTASMDGFPACELIVVDGSKERNDPRITFEISCQWTVNGDDSERMSRELKRLIIATRRFFEGMSVLPFVGGSPISVGRSDYGPITARAGKPDYLLSASVALFLEAVV